MGSLQHNHLRMPGNTQGLEIKSVVVLQVIGHESNVSGA